jgi:hypothetical protein
MVTLVVVSLHVISPVSTTGDDFDSHVVLSVIVSHHSNSTTFVMLHLERSLFFLW